MNEAVELVRKEIGRRFKRQRMRSGIVGSQLSQRCGLSKSYVCRVERGITNYKINSLIALIGEMQEPPKSHNNINIIYRSIKKYNKYLKALLIAKTVSDYFGLSNVLVKGKTRKSEFCQARYYGFKLMEDLIKLSHADIGRIYHRDRTTVLLGLQEFSDWIDTKYKLAEDYPIVFSKVSKALGYDSKEN